MTYGAEYLITGVCGMVGYHLVEALNARGASFAGAWYNPQAWQPPEGPPFYECDMRYFPGVWELIHGQRPRFILHGAAQSYPTVSWERPEETIAINVIGTVQLFEAVKRQRELDSAYDPLVLVMCSSAQYGLAMRPESPAIDEEAPMLPLHPYGVSKVAQDNLASQYFVCDRIRTLRARIFNTTGPRKRHDVISDWARRVVSIEQGEAKTLRVGNLTARRAVMDVSDLIAALFLLLEKGAPGEAYNICHDRLVSMQELLGHFQAHARKPFAHAEDASLIRVMDEPVIFGSNRKLKAATGWQPRVQPEEMVRRMLEHERIAYASARL